MFPPRNAVAYVSVIALSLALAGCPVVEGALDTSGLGIAQYDEAYTGSLAVLDYDGPASFALNSGELPPGLSITEAGGVSGTPTLGGIYTFDVRTFGLSNVEDFTEEVTMEVSVENVDGAFLGYDHDQVNNMTDAFGLMSHIWVRVSEAGVEEAWTHTVDFGVYVDGGNGTEENGYGDDVRIGKVDPSEIETSINNWDPTGPVEANPGNGYPSVHYPEDDPPTYHSDDGIFEAGVDGGDGNVRFTHEDFGEVNTRILVVPPDWCPDGEHEGGPNTAGFCE